MSGGDSLWFDIIAEGDELLNAALLIAFGGSDEDHKVERYEIREIDATPTLILFWGGPAQDYPNSHPLPRLDRESTLPFINAWLKSVDRPRYPDIDGDCEPGWRVFSEYAEPGWGDPYSLLAVQFHWCIYGK